MSTLLQSGRTLAMCAALVSVVALTSCSSNTTNPPSLTVPTEYPGADFIANTGKEASILSDISTLSGTMQSGRAGSAVDFTTMSNQFAPLRSQTSALFVSLADGLLYELSKASNAGPFDPMKSPAESGDGGVYGGYLFDEHGLELQQLVEKGMYAATSYHHMVQLMKSSRLTIPQLDACVAIFGASPEFPNGSSSAVTPDAFAAKYAARRDQNNGSGPYTLFRDAALVAHAAISAGEDYAQRERDALSAMRLQWEEAQMGTVVFYLYQTIDLLSQTTVSDEDRASAMHSFSECVGFILGYRGLETSVSVISLEEVDELLETMRVPPTGAWTPYVFWQNPAANLGDLQRVLTKIQTIYDFSDTEMDNFAYNWVELQQR